MKEYKIKVAITGVPQFITVMAESKEQAIEKVVEYGIRIIF